MAKYFSQEWWDSRTSSQKMVFNVAALVPAARVGGALWKGAQTVRGIRGASTAVSVAKRPAHSYLAEVTTHTGRHMWLQDTLQVRKKLGVAALGYSAINPLQSINYARKKDWNRLFWNIRYPIVGVPLYNFYLDSKGSGSPPSASSTRTNKKTRRPGMKSRKFKYKFPKPGSPASGSRQYEAGKRRTNWAVSRRQLPRKCPPGYYWNAYKRKCVKYRYRKR